MAAEVAPRFCILGNSLSGLSTAFLLQRAIPRAHVTVLTNGKKAGVLSSVRGRGGQVLETGLHSSVIVDKNGRETLGFLKLLGLEEDVLSAHIENSSRRHLFHKGKVQLFPRSHHVLGYCPALVAEPLWPRGRNEDESVHDFVSRRASRGVADRIADPICRGLLAGDAKELSVRTCFPRLWYNERRFSSVFIGSALSTFSSYSRRSWMALDLLDPLLQRVSVGGRCYTLKQGLGSMTDQLDRKLREPQLGTRPVEFLDDEIVGINAKPLGPVEGDTFPPAAAEVKFSGGQSLPVDSVISALRPSELASIIDASGVNIQNAGGSSLSFCEGLQRIRHASVAVVSVVFDGEVLKNRYQGAGYFVGSLEKQDIIGMTWDSMLYPTTTMGRTRVTVYASVGDESDENTAEERALRAVRDHLGIQEEPAEVQSKTWKDTVPQYILGHRRWLQDFDDCRMHHLPFLQVVGPGFYGTRSVADEIVDVRVLVDSLVRRFARYPHLVENEVVEDSSSRYGLGFDAD